MHMINYPVSTIDCPERVRSQGQQIGLSSKQNDKFRSVSGNSNAHMNNNQNIENSAVRIPYRSVSESKKDKLSKEAYLNKQRSVDQRETRLATKLPYIKYKNFPKAEDYLASVGYNPDTRVKTQIYNDLVEKRKKSFHNRLDVLRNKLKQLKGKKYAREKFSVKSKIMVEEIKRKREREAITHQDKHGRMIWLLTTAKRQ